MMMSMKLLLLVNNVMDDGILVSLLTKLTHAPAKILNVNSACCLQRSSPSRSRSGVGVRWCVEGGVGQGEPALILEPSPS
jgi:hypothetical protein